MKLLILGSTGTLGTGIEEACKEKNIEYVPLTHNEFEIGTFTESEITQYGCDTIVNCVALMGVNLCEENPNKTFSINSTPVRKLAQIAQENRMVLVQPSTHGVFDGRNNPYTEDSNVNPLNTYSISKYASECFTRNWCEEYFITRLPILFGKKKNTPVGFIDKLPIWLKEGKELRMAIDRRDSLAYNKDVGKEIIRLIESKMQSGTYHIFNSGQPTYYEFACRLRDLYGFGNKIIKAKDSDFPSDGPKAQSIEMSSVFIPPMRSWDAALEEFVRIDGGHFD